MMSWGFGGFMSAILGRRIDLGMRSESSECAKSRFAASQ
jgi:hypothetical protein